MPGYLIAIIIVFGTIVLYEFCEFLCCHSKRYKSALGGADRLKHVPCDLDICNIGSGPGLYAISYEKCPLNGFNFSTAPQNYENGFKLLKRFQEKINDNAIIIIIIMCPLSFGKNGDYDSEGYMDKFYGVLPKNEIKNYSFKRLWIVKHPLMMWCLSFVKKTFVKAKRKKEESSPSQLITTEPGVVKGWKKEFNLADLKDPTQVYSHQEAFKEKITILENGINFCLKKTWKPVFVIPPVPEKTRQYISKEFANEFVYKNLEALQRSHPDVRTLDYFCDERFTQDCFSGDIFANEKGRELFSKILFKDLGLTDEAKQ